MCNYSVVIKLHEVYTGCSKIISPACDCGLWYFVLFFICCISLIWLNKLLFIERKKRKRMDGSFSGILDPLIILFYRTCIGLFNCPLCNLRKLCFAFFLYSFVFSSNKILSNSSFFFFFFFYSIVERFESRISSIS